MMFREFEVALPARSGRDFDIRDYGAIPDGQTSNTAAFAAAIRDAGTEGGRVLVPNGIWRTGPVRLISGVELHLADNALILFSKSPEEYPLMVTDYEGIRRIRAVSPILAEDAEDIAITGGGTIDGSGHLWRPVKQFKLTGRQWAALTASGGVVIHQAESDIWVPTRTIYDGHQAGEVYPDACASEEAALRKAAPYYDYYRPVMVSLRHCRRVLVEGVRIQNSPAWCVHPYFCEDLTLRHLTIFNPYHAQNGDGIDVDSCNRVHIHHCDLQTGDDGICLKSGKDREARKLLQPCENVLVHDCRVGHSHGGFVIGSEMSRGVRNVLVRDCTFIDADVGLRFKSAMGRGGVVEDIWLTDIQMVDIREQPVILTMHYMLNQMGTDDPVKQSEDPADIPFFRRIHFTRCRCTGAGRPVTIDPLAGHPETIRDIFFDACDLDNQEG
ncbi:MAG: glycoside hydrolase family 28 protein [Butyrivibrio sp.]|nr:glycoside hydrolase family 28 protein [Butyrivibrio sp.]